MCKQHSGSRDQREGDANGGSGIGVASTQYATDANLRARQRLWQISPRVPPFALYPWVIGLLGLRGSEAVLEVGCGNGGYLELITAVGLDSSPGMLQAARSRARGTLVCGDASALPFSDLSFDTVLAAHMLYHVEDRLSAVMEMRRVLVPGGVCVAVTNSQDNHAEMVRLVEQVVGRGWRWRRPSDSAFSLENGAAQLKAGFDEVEIVRAPDGVVSVTDPDALADYLASVGDHYQEEVGGWTSWDDVVRECRRRTASRIQAEGSFAISTSMGAFVCR